MKLEEARQFWKVANTFPPDKESVYPTHATAHEFDAIEIGDKALEYGCGGGSDTVSMLRRGADVTFVDIVPENVEATRFRVLLGPVHLVDVPEAGRQRQVQATGFVLESSDKLPVEDCLFDRINCHGVLHHIEEDTMHSVIDEFHRVLRPGGHLYAMLYTEVLFANAKVQYEGLCRQGWSHERAFSYCTDGGGIARYYTERDGRALFELHGFEVVSTIEYNDREFRTFKARKT